MPRPKRLIVAVGTSLCDSRELLRTPIAQGLMQRNSMRLLFITLSRTSELTLCFMSCGLATLPSQHSARQAFMSNIGAQAAGLPKEASKELHPCLQQAAVIVSKGRKLESGQSPKLMSLSITSTFNALWRTCGMLTGGTTACRASRLTLLSLKCCHSMMSPSRRLAARVPPIHRCAQLSAIHMQALRRLAPEACPVQHDCGLSVTAETMRLQ